MAFLSNKKDNSAIKREKFDNIYSMYFVYVGAIIYKITNDKASIDDLAHDVFTKFWEKFDTIPDLDEAKAWLSVVSRNTAINWNKKRNTINNAITDIDDDILSDISRSPSPDVAEIIASNDNVEFIFSQINCLDKKYSDILMLYFKFHYTTNEIAKLLDMNIKTVYTRFERGKLLLRKLLVEYERSDKDVRR